MLKSLSVSILPTPVCSLNSHTSYALDHCIVTSQFNVFCNIFSGHGRRNRRAINTECFQKVGSMILRRKHPAKGYWRAIFLPCIPATLVVGGGNRCSPHIENLFSRLSHLQNHRQYNQEAHGPPGPDKPRSDWVLRVVQPSCDSGVKPGGPESLGLSSARRPSAGEGEGFPRPNLRCPRSWV